MDFEVLVIDISPKFLVSLECAVVSFSAFFYSCFCPSLGGAVEE